MITCSLPPEHWNVFFFCSLWFVLLMVNSYSFAYLTSFLAVFTSSFNPSYIPLNGKAKPTSLQDPYQPLPNEVNALHQLPFSLAFIPVCRFFIISSMGRFWMLKMRWEIWFLHRSDLFAFLLIFSCLCYRWNSL